MFGWIVLAAGALFVILLVQNKRTPSLGLQNGQLRVLGPKPNAVSSQTDRQDRYVPPIPIPGKLGGDDVMHKIHACLSSMEGCAIKVEEDRYLRCVFTTPVLHFHDDVEIFVDDDVKEVHFRSASRCGYSDLGVNRKRYKVFSGKLFRLFSES